MDRSSVNDTAASAVEESGAPDPRVVRGRAAANAVIDAYAPFRAGWLNVRRWRYGGTVDLRLIAEESLRADAKRLVVSLYRRGQAEPNDWRSDGVARGQHYLLTKDGLQAVERVARAERIADVDFALPERKQLPAPTPAVRAAVVGSDLEFDAGWRPSADEDDALVRADERRRRVASGMKRSKAMTDAAIAAAAASRGAALDDPRDGVTTQPIRPEFAGPDALGSGGSGGAEAADADRRDALGALEAASGSDGRAAIHQFLSERPELGQGLGLGARARAGARKAGRDGAA